MLIFDWKVTFYMRRSESLSADMYLFYPKYWDTITPYHTSHKVWTKICEDTKEMPQSWSTALPRHQKKERRRTKKNKKKKNTLSLKTPRKPASENVLCLCCLQNILANFSNLFLHTGKQCGPRSDLKKQSDLGPHCLQKWLLKSQADYIADDNCCDWQFKG